MVRLYQFLTVASGIVLLITLGMVGWLYNRQAVQNVTEITTKHNIGIDRVLLDVILARYGASFATAGTLNSPALGTRPEMQEIQRLVAALTASANISKVKIYNREGITLYSSDPAEIGEDYSYSRGFLAATREGVPNSALLNKSHTADASGEIKRQNLVETYVPIWNANQGVVGVIEFYTDVSDIKGSIDQMTIAMLAGMFLIVGSLYGVLVFGIMRRAIAPIGLAASYAAEIGPRSTGMRLPTQGMPREILPLIVAANGAFERLDRALNAQRQFSVDAAHELLSPIAVLKANLGSLESTESVESLREDVGAMSAVVTQLLELAELDAPDGATGDATELRPVCQQVVSMLAPVAGKDGKVLKLTGSDRPIKVRCRQPLLRRALQNLIENSVVRTPPGTIVEIEIREDGSVTIADKGPKIPPDHRTTIFRSLGYDQAKAGSGNGLGLSIVKRIAEACGGGVDAGDAPGGGTVFTLRLPLA